MDRSQLAGRALVALLAIVTLALVARTATNLAQLEVPPSMEFPSAGDALSPGRAAPDFRLATVGGDSLSLAELRGQIVLIDFWATWCGPCLQEMPALQQIYDDYADRGVEIVAVSCDVTPGVVPDVVARMGITFPVALEGLPVQALYRVDGLPTVIIVDRQGVIRFHHLGYAPGAEAALVDEIEALLAED